MKHFWWWGVGICVSLAVAAVWQMRFMDAKIILCDVGQGDAIVLVHGSSQLVIDVGSDNGGLLGCLGQNIPFWDREIEALFLTHADTDHVGALNSLLAHYRIDRIVTTVVSGAEVKASVKDRSPVVFVQADDTWQWGSVVGNVLWPKLGGTEKDKNHASLVMRIQFSRGTSVWLAGDADQAVEQTLLDEGMVRETTILKVAHHGSETATSADFLGILRPRQAWISVGAGNRYGHPAPGVLSVLANNQAVIRRTDMEGTIVYRDP